MKKPLFVALMVSAMVGLCMSIIKFAPFRSRGFLNFSGTEQLRSETDIISNLTVFPRHYSEIVQNKALNPKELCIAYYPDDLTSSLNSDQILNILKKCDVNELEVLRIDYCPNGSDKLWKKISEFKKLKLLSLGYCNCPGKLFVDLKNLKVLELKRFDNTKLPKEICEMSDLEELHIYESAVKTLPDEIARLKNLKVLSIGITPIVLTKTIEELKNLEDISVFSCGLISLPIDFFKLPKLKSLVIRNNKFTKLPKGMENVEYVDFAYNPLKVIPPEVFRKERTVLDLSGCDLVVFPKEICEMKQLRKLILRGNKGLKFLPTEIGGMENLEYLDCDSCSLKNLTKELGKLRSLKYLWFGYNQIKEIPAEIGNLKNLERLELRGCNLMTLPKEIGNLKSLKILNLSDNKKLSLPSEIGDLENLEVLRLDSCGLTRIPETIGKLKKLEELTMNYNSLTEFPKGICKLESLKKLELSDNKLESLPSKITHLKSLEVLYLSRCPLKTLPKEMGKLKNLKRLLLEDCNLKELPKEIGHLKSLRTLILSKNEKISLPKKMEKLSNLEILYLNGCGLTKLPNWIGQLKNLTHLYLRRNPNLTELPPEIENLDNLIYVDAYGLKIKPSKAQ